MSENGLIYYLYKQALTHRYKKLLIRIFMFKFHNI
jgi:hypothetical protein